MIVWALILLTIPVGITVYAILDDFKELIFFALMFLILLLIPIGGGLTNIQAASVFQEQSRYLELFEPEDMIENAALTNKRIELNEWLYKAQWGREMFGVFSLYPASVLDLEPIR